MFSVNKKYLSEVYEPVEPNSYKYSGLNNLNHEININSHNFFICIYQVNNSYLYPFLQFLFIQNNNNYLVFPKLNLLYKLYNTNSVIDYAYQFINTITENTENNEYKGSLFYENNSYLFFDVTACVVNINCIYKNSNIWFALIDEIINEKHICNIDIHSDVTIFFCKNSEFLFLTNKTDTNYETPSVVYVGKEVSRIKFTYIFGMPKPDNNDFLGPYYYFTNFKNAIKQGGWSHNEKPEKKYDIITEDGKYIKGGVVRFALFTGLTKVILNNIEDSIDESDIKRELIKNPENNYENLTLRITDYDGKWADSYDSVYIGNLELDNGEKMKETYVYVVKKYEQQVPLTYHYIDKPSFDDMFDPNKNYNIL
jgi:hypothetical protein